MQEHLHNTYCDELDRYPDRLVDNDGDHGTLPRANNNSH